MKKILLLILVIIASLNIANAANIKIVAAESQYGSVAEFIGGDKVDVTSIINSANGDPHTFISSIKNAKIIADANIIIYNGADYDTWINSILKTTKAQTIKVQDLGDFKSTGKLGINPHLWYGKDIMPKLAKAITKKLSAIYPEDKAYFEANYKKFESKFADIDELIKNIKDKYKGTPVTSTEPIFGYMADSLGLKMEGQKFQWVIMNGSEPSPRMMISYLSLLHKHKVAVLFYNDQVTDVATKNILQIAKKDNIPVVGVSEIMPKDTDVISWITNTLEETQQALAKSKEDESKS